MINKADDREARARFVNHSYDLRWPKQTIHSSWSFIDLLPKSLPRASDYQENSQRDANSEIQVENARFQRNARRVLVLRHVPGCNDLRSQTMAEKNADREDFRGANHLRLDNSRNRSMQP